MRFFVQAIATRSIVISSFPAMAQDRSFQVNDVVTVSSEGEIIIGLNGEHQGDIIDLNRGHLLVIGTSSFGSSAPIEPLLQNKK